MNYEIQFLKALSLTIFIETIVLFLLGKIFLKKERVNNYTLLLTGILPTFATLPYVWFIFPLFIKSQIGYHIFSETFAVVAESFMIMGLLRIKYSKAIMVSVICNMFSYIIGLLVNWS